MELERRSFCDLEELVPNVCDKMKRVRENGGIIHYPTFALNGEATLEKKV